jgi:glycosyltransferase involved in cell wall biosynthesis
MKVLQVVPGISPNFGGPSVALTGLTRLLAQRGIETMLVTTNVDPRGRLDVPLGVPVSQLGANVLYFNAWPRGRYAFSFPLACALRQIIHDYNVVHIHWLYNFSSLIAAIAAQKAGIPYVLQPNGSLDPHLMKRNNLLKKIYLAMFGNYIVKNASVIIFTSEIERKQASLDGFRVPARVVPVGLDWAEYANLPPRGEFKKQYPEIGNKQMVLFLGRMSRQKGLDLLIPAFRIVAARHPAVHLVVAGPDGEGYGTQVKQWVAEANLKNRVTFAGPLSEQLKLAAYVDSDVFVLPSYAENFGATVTEALACKRPVVISNRVNICDEIASAEAGIVVECSADSVADGIGRVLGDPDLAERLGENGYEMVRQKFTWDAALDMLIPIYRELAGEAEGSEG